jgi:hypothetical protein
MIFLCYSTGLKSRHAKNVINVGKLNWEAVAADTIYGMQNSFKQTDTKIMCTTGADGQQASSDQSQERLANAQEEQRFKLGEGGAQVNQGATLGGQANKVYSAMLDAFEDTQVNSTVLGIGTLLADASGNTMTDVGQTPTQEAMRRLASTHETNNDVTPSKLDKSILNGREYKEHSGAVDDPLSLVGLPSVGTGQCAALVKQEAEAPRTQPDNWYKRTDITPSAVVDLEVGTPVASGWNEKSFYPNNNTGQHSGIYAGPVYSKNGDVVGFKIVEPCSSTPIIKSGDVYFDPKANGKPNTYYYNASRYSTIGY